MAGIISLKEHFVGRTDELAALLEAFEIAAGGQSTFVALAGEAGVGKSRLAREFANRLSFRAVNAAWGHCLQNLHTPFLPLDEIFATLGLEVATAELSQQDDTLSAPFTPDAQIRRFKHMSAFLQSRPNAPLPLAIVIEDLQWADAATLGFLEYLAATRPPGPIFVLLTIQTEALDRPRGFARTLARMRAAGLVTIPLRPLDHAEMAELIRGVSPKPIPRSSAERIKQLAEGNPLFAEELLRAVLDDGQEVIVHPAFSTIRTTVLERFYQLTERDQRVLSCAAVVGRVFDARIVADLVGQPLVEVFAGLRRARNLQLIREQQRGVESHDVAFRHAVFCDVIYHELLVVEARELHARAAEAIEASSDATRHLSELAYHWSMARNSTKALRHNMSAGDAAMKLAAYEDAARFYDEALSQASMGSQLYAEIAEKRAYAWYAAGVLERTHELFTQALDAYATLGNRQKVVEMTLFQSRQAWNDAETPRGYDHALGAIELIDDDDDELRGYALTMAASYAVHLGRPDEAKDLLAQTQPKTDVVLARHFDTLGIARCRLGDASGALEAMRLAREVADRSCDPDVIIRVYTNSADVYAVYCNSAMQLDLWNKAFSAAQASGYIGRTAYTALGYACALIDAGELQRARELYALALETGVSNASVIILASCVDALLRALLGDATPTLRPTSSALDLAIRSRESVRIGQVGSALGFAAIVEQRLDEAREILERTVTAVEAPEFAEVLLALGGTVGSQAVRKRSAEVLEGLGSRRENTLARACHDMVLACARLGSERSTVLRSVATRWQGFRRPLFQALALLLAGDLLAARDVFESIGAVAAVARLTKSPVKVSRSLSTLTRREGEVARLIVEGHSNRAIADRLGITEKTAEHHVASILARLGLRSRWLVTPQLLERTFEAASNLSAFQ